MLLPIKNNIGDDKTGFGYSIGAGLNGGATVLWEPELVTTTVEEAMAPVVRDDDEPKPERSAAMKWLQDFLQGGPTPVPDIKTAVKDAGLTWATVRRAKDDLGIESRKDTFSSSWRWWLPEHVDDEDSYHEGAHDTPVPEQREHLGDENTEKALQINTPVEGAHVSTLGEHLGEKTAQDAHEDAHVSTLGSDVDFKGKNSKFSPRCSPAHGDGGGEHLRSTVDGAETDAEIYREGEL